MAKKQHQVRGIKRSSTLKVQRQVLLLRCLSQHSAPADELIKQVNSLMLEAYPQAAKAAFRHDLRTLRDVFNCEIDYRAGQGYELVSVGDLALLELSDDEIRGLRYLHAQFPVQATLPEHSYVRRLIDHLIDLLPLERRGALNTAEPLLGQSGPRTVYQYDHGVVRAIRRAIKQRRELCFQYQPSLRPGEEYHRVAPQNIFTRDSHLYLLAYCIEGPRDMAERVGGYVDYRVDYMLPDTVEVLPKVLPRKLPARKTWVVRYQLDANVARNRHVAHWFADTHIDYLEDGSALVEAHVYNLWQTCQILMRYKGACTVLEPTELVEMMRDAARQILQCYGDD